MRPPPSLFPGLPHLLTDVLNCLIRAQTFPGLRKKGLQSQVPTRTPPTGRLPSVELLLAGGVITREVQENQRANVERIPGSGTGGGRSEGSGGGLGELRRFACVDQAVAFFAVCLLSCRPGLCSQRREEGSRGAAGETVRGHVRLGAEQIRRQPLILLT